MRIAVLYYPHREGHNSVFPLFAYADLLREMGFYFDFFTSVSAFLSAKVDLLLVSGISLPKLLKSDNWTKVEFLERCYSRQIPLAYLSGSDSTGPFESEIIQTVDLFLNRQLVKDRSHYLKPHRRHFFRDTYFQTHHFRNESDFQLISYSKEEVDKFGIYWNLGLIDWKTQTSSKILRYWNIFRRNGGFSKTEKGTDLNERKFDLMFRGNLFKDTHDACRLHRLQTYRVYQSPKSTRTMPSEGLVSHKKYIQELRQVKICLSPFGWGEVCYRDFEAFQTSSLLVKPDMSHLDTFPNFYSQETMVSYDWYARDLSGKIEHILENPSLFQEIADFGYKNFLKETQGKEAKEKFGLHFRGLIAKAYQNFEKRK